MSTREDVLLDEVGGAAVPIVVGIGADDGLNRRQLLSIIFVDLSVSCELFF